MKNKFTVIELGSQRPHKGWDCSDLSLSCKLAQRPGKWFWCKGCQQWIRLVESTGDLGPSPAPAEPKDGPAPVDHKALDWEVTESGRMMELAHMIWMNTPVHAPNAGELREAKDAAAKRYSAALAARGQAGGRAYPSWNEASNFATKRA